MDRNDHNVILSQTMSLDNKSFGNWAELNNLNRLNLRRPKSESMLNALAVLNTDSDFNCTIIQLQNRRHLQKTYSTSPKGKKEKTSPPLFNPVSSLSPFYPRKAPLIFSQHLALRHSSTYQIANHFPWFFVYADTLGVAVTFTQAARDCSFVCLARVVLDAQFCYLFLNKPLELLREKHQIHYRHVHPRVFSRKRNPLISVNKSKYKRKVNMTFIYNEILHRDACVLVFMQNVACKQTVHFQSNIMELMHYLGNSAVDHNDPLKSMFRHETP